MTENIETVCQTDRIQQRLEIDDWVAVSLSDYTDLIIAKVVGFTPKRIRVEYVPRSSWHNELRKRTVASEQCVKIDSQAVCMYLMQKS